MTPWIISHDLMRANDGETARAVRYAHHRAHTYRRPGRILVALLDEWTSKIRLRRHPNSASADLSFVVREPLNMAVFNLGGEDAGGGRTAPVLPGRTT